TTTSFKGCPSTALIGIGGSATGAGGPAVIMASESATVALPPFVANDQRDLEVAGSPVRVQAEEHDHHTGRRTLLNHANCPATEGVGNGAIAAIDRVSRQHCHNGRASLLQSSHRQS